MLYIIATPIGNLSDITLRAIETLKSCDRVFCEDSRYSLRLLQHYQIKKPLTSLHKFNEAKKLEQIIDLLQQGEVIGLISDAGTPGIADPGSMLVQRCRNEGIQVTPIPGACACIAALCCSGLNTDRFQFCGFLPRKPAELKSCLQEILAYPGTTVCYEVPNRLMKSLACLHQLAPERLLAVARELTKLHEEWQRGSAQQLIDHWRDKEIKGEIVLMISGQTGPQSLDWQDLSLPQHVEKLQAEYQVSKQEAIVLVAKIRGVKKREVYNAIHVKRD